MPLESCGRSIVDGFFLSAYALIASAMSIYICEKGRKGRREFRCIGCQRLDGMALSKNKYMNSNGIFEFGKTWSWELRSVARHFELFRAMWPADLAAFFLWAPALSGYRSTNVSEDRNKDS
jgi:hypothetical protein